MLRFDGRVAIITGAGGGLGREYALLFAERGAAVVVNDLGGSAFGDGKGTSMADKVVEEIRSKGGKAVANYDSVENGDKIVKTAIENFGRIDIVVNNAGILRDKSFQNMTDLDWDLIYRVHLKGAYSVSKAAWPIMKKQNYGKIIMTSSNAGVYGNFGQANYSAAKSALIGLSHTLAMEGAKYNVFSNAIVPTAGSRLTQTVMPADLVDALKPEYIAPMVVWLCHEKCPDNGGLFEAAAGWFGKLEYSRAEGVVLRTKNHKVVPEDVRDNWEEITSMENAQHYTKTSEVTSKLVDVLQEVDSSDDSSTNQEGGQDVASIARRAQFKPLRLHYTVRDTIVYALSIGCTVDKNLQFLYEAHENFSVFPLFAVVPSFGTMGRLLQLDIPGLKLDLQRLLHGEQYFEFHKTFLPDDHLTSQAKIVDVLDKGNGAVILMNVDIKNKKQELIASGQYSIFFRGSGGFGGSRTSSEEKQLAPAPQRKPDSICEEKTCLEQAALYRQGSGDLNPLHIDPQFAQLAGFERPILHGLSSFGFSVRHVLDKYARGDVSKLRAVKARFSAPVIPGQTLITEMWREGDRVHFQTKVKETGKTAISGAYADFRALEAGDEGNKSSGGSTTAKTDLKSAAVFEELQKRLKTQPDIVKTVQAVYLYIITKNGAEAAKYTVDLKTGEGSIYEGEPKGDKAGVTLTISDDDMVGLVSGKLNPQQAFMSGKMKIKGNIMLATKLQTLLKDHSKL